MKTKIRSLALLLSATMCGVVSFEQHCWGIQQLSYGNDAAAQFSVGDQSPGLTASTAGQLGTGFSPTVTMVSSPSSSTLAYRYSIQDAITVQADGDASKLAVPKAPGVDQNSDPSGRPLTVPSNAATMPDEFYRTSNCNLGQPYRLVDRQDTGLRIGGWHQLGWHTQDNGLFNNRKNELNLHQSWGFVEKEFQTNRGIGVKLRGDLMYGLDAGRLQAFGNEPFAAPEDWDNSWDNGSYGWALPQAYSEIKFQRATVRTGRFLSPFGFENAAAVENFFYSHTYTYTLTHPHTMTGSIVQTDLNDSTSVYFGGTNGWDTAISGVGLAGIGGFTHRIDDSRVLTYGTSFGDFGARGTGFFNSLVYAVQATDKVQLALQSDWLDSDLTEDFSVTGYGIYRFSKCLAAGARVEYWETDSASTNDESAIAFTSGLNYRPHANIVVRPEVRTDWNGAAVAKGDINLGLDVVVTY